MKPKAYSFVRAGTLVPTAIALSLTISTAVAKPIRLNDVLPRLMVVDPTVKAAAYDAKSKKLSLYNSISDYFPAVNMTSKYGTQKIDNKTGSASSNMQQNEEDLKLTQLIYDFGKTGSAIRTAKLSYDQSLTSLLGTRQDTMVTGAKSYLDVYEKYMALAYARRNESNIADQVKMEMARKQSGSGYQTDVLEAKAQYSGAKAKVTQAEGALKTAINEYKKVFLEEPKEPAKFALPPIPMGEIPKTVKAAVSIAEMNSTDLRDQQYTVDIAKQTIQDKRATFFPTVEATAEAKYSYNMNGSAGKKQEYTGMLEVDYPIFESFGDVANYRASKYDLAAAEQRLYNQRLTTERAVRDDWEEMTTARTNAAYLDKQAEQLAQFLKLAKKERQLGRKTLLEVLVADTNYVNALQESIAAKVKVNNAIYTLLKDMGILKLQMFSPNLPGARQHKLMHPISRAEETKQSAVTRARRPVSMPPQVGPRPQARPAVRRGGAPVSAHRGYGQQRPAARPGAAPAQRRQPTRVAPQQARPRPNAAAPRPTQEQLRQRYQRYQQLQRQRQQQGAARPTPQQQRALTPQQRQQLLQRQRQQQMQRQAAPQPPAKTNGMDF